MCWSLPGRARGGSDVGDEDDVFLGTNVPADLAERFRWLAEENARSMGHEIRRALLSHLNLEGERRERAAREAAPVACRRLSNGRSCTCCAGRTGAHGGLNRPCPADP
jgi:hypothetical protein